VTSEKQRPHGWNRGASKQNNGQSVTGPNKGPFRGSSKLKVASAFMREVVLPGAYKGPFCGWWGCLK